VQPNPIINIINNAPKFENLNFFLLLTCTALMIFYISISLLLDVHSVLSNPFISLLPLFPVKDGTETQQEPTGKFRFNSCEQIEQLLALYLTAGGPAAAQYPSSQIQREESNT